MKNPVFEKIKECIENALEECQKKIYDSPNSVLSEADFERMLSNEIEKQINREVPGYGVHNQVSHYSELFDVLDARVDIIIMKKEDITECLEHHKAYVYKKSAFVLELKYLHPKDSLNGVEYDIKKRKILDGNSWLYVVPLFIVSSDEDFNEKEAKVKGMVDEYLATATEKKEVFYKCLRKNL